MASSSSAYNTIWDIDRVELFPETFDALVLEHGQQPFSSYTNSVLRYGVLEEDIIKSRLPDGLLVVANGGTYGGQVHPAGLTAALERILFAHAHMNPESRKIHEKMKVEYLANAEKTITFFLARMTSNTRAYFSANTDFQLAMVTKDLVKATHIFKTRGYIGTGDQSDARLRLEQLIYQNDSTLQLANAGEGGYDFNHWCDVWRKLRTALIRFETRLGEADFSKGFVNSLPSKAVAIKASMLAPEVLPPNLDAAMTRLRGMIIAMNIKLSNCRGAFGIYEAMTGKKNKTPPADETSTAPDLSKQRVTDNEDFIEKIVAAVTVSMQQIRDTTGRGGGGGRGNEQGRGGRGGRGERKPVDFKKECPAFEAKQECTFEKDNGRSCRYRHSKPYTNVGGHIKILIVKSASDK